MPRNEVLEQILNRPHSCWIGECLECGEPHMKFQCVWEDYELETTHERDDCHGEIEWNLQYENRICPESVLRDIYEKLLAK